MYYRHKVGFTMIELVFVIVVIGILSAIAIPRFAATRDDAMISKGKSILASVRSSIATERQKRILKGDFTPITDLSNGGTGLVFSKFSDDKDGSANQVLEYPPKSCTSDGCWSGSGTSYVFHVPGGGSCTYTLSNNSLATTGCDVFGE